MCTAFTGQGRLARAGEHAGSCGKMRISIMKTSIFRLSRLSQDSFNSREPIHIRIIQAGIYKPLSHVSTSSILRNDTIRVFRVYLLERLL